MVGGNKNFVFVWGGGESLLGEIFLGGGMSKFLVDGGILPTIPQVGKTLPTYKKHVNRYMEFQMKISQYSKHMTLSLK